MKENIGVLVASARYMEHEVARVGKVGTYWLIGEKLSGTLTQAYRKFAVTPFLILEVRP